MKPFHLQIQLTANSGNVTVQWLGPSAVQVEGSRTFLRRADVLAIPAADTFLIDLNPLLAEIADGTISDVEELQTADEFYGSRIR